MSFGEKIFTFSKGFPDDEKYNLISQIRRAADSVALNIAEGSVLQSNAEFRKFLGYSIAPYQKLSRVFIKQNTEDILKKIIS